MKIPRRILLIDETPGRASEWEKNLQGKVEVIQEQTLDGWMEQHANIGSFLEEFACVIVARRFKNCIDTCKDGWALRFRELGHPILFLLWEGPVTQLDLASRFDGRIVRSEGITWAHLRSRITRAWAQRSEALEEPGAMARPHRMFRPEQTRRVVRKITAEEYTEHRHYLRGEARKLLLAMATRAQGSHRDLLNLYARQEIEKGIQLLEAIYNRLTLASAEAPQLTCPSRYIDASPVIARNRLRDLLTLRATGRERSA